MWGFGRMSTCFYLFISLYCQFKLLALLGSCGLSPLKTYHSLPKYKIPQKMHTEMLQQSCQKQPTKIPVTLQQQQISPNPNICQSPQKTQMLIQKTFVGNQSIQKLKYTNQSTLLQLLQSIFDDVTLYNDDQIRGILMKSDKGFITIQEIMGMGIFREFMHRNVDIFISPDQICRVVNQESKKLIAVNYRIKRVEPFVDNISNQVLKSVYIQKLPNRNTNQIYQFFKNIVGVIYQIYHKKNERWVIIVIDNYEALERIKDQLYYGDNKLTVLSPLETLSSYGENQRLSSEFNIVRLYNNKSLFEDPPSDIDNDDDEQNCYMQKKSKNRNNYRGGPVSGDQQKQFLRNFDPMTLTHQYDGNLHPKFKQRRQRNRNNKHKSAVKRELDIIMNYDNSALLALRGMWNTGMME